MRKMLLAVALVFSAFAVFGEVAETRYSADGGETWTEGTLTEAVTAANKNADTIIELNKNVKFPAGSQLTFSKASQKVLLRSNTETGERYTITRTAGVGGSTEANLKLNAASVSLTIENILIDLGGTKGNVISTISSTASNSSVVLGEGVEIFNAKMSDSAGTSSLVQMIGQNSSLTLDGAVIHDITGANMILYASATKSGVSIIINAGGVRNCEISASGDGKSVVNVASARYNGNNSFQALPGLRRRIVL